MMNEHQTTIASESKRTQELFQETQLANYKRTDRIFVALMMLQWLGGVVIAAVLSPQGWAGSTSQIHWHLWAAIFLGGAITFFPIFLALRHSGEVLTRHTIGVAQMMMSALLIHLTGGRIETHFHVFGSLAFLAFYRDWRVMLSATIVVGLDHLLRGMYWPESVFGVLTSSHWRWIEHVVWVVFEDVFLFISIKQGLAEMWRVSERQSQLESLNFVIEQRIEERTVELKNEVHERRAIEQVLRNRESLLQSTLESTADGILVVDENQRVTHWNARYKELWSIPDGVLETSPASPWSTRMLDQLVDPDAFRDSALRLHLGLSDSLDTIECTDGRVFERYSCPMTGSGELTGRVWSFRDMTKSKRAEEARLALQESLEKAQRMESLGLLAGGVAHDLNNNLSPVIGFSEVLIAEHAGDEETIQSLNRIIKSATDAATVVHDLLTLSRRGRYDMQASNLNEILSEVVESPTFKTLCLGRPTVRINLSLTSNIGPVNGSEAHLSKAFMNLLRNAFDAMPFGGVLTIKTSQQFVQMLDRWNESFVPGHYIIVTISDTGEGVLQENVNRIFEPYFSTKKIGQSGSGLGLSVVHGVVVDHKGFYDVRSEVAKGTEFVLYFPVEKHVIKKADPVKVTSTGGTEAILIIDDDPTLRELGIAIFSRLGYRAVAAEHGHDALRILATETFDLLMLDMIMEPEFDGLDTYREILKIHPQQKAIVVSGYSTTQRVQGVLELGAAKFLKKPYLMDDLSKAIRHALDTPFAPLDSASANARELAQV